MRPAAAPPRRPRGTRLLGKVPDRVLRAGRRDRPIAQLPPLGLRVAGLAAVALIVFAVILFRLWFLQILTGQQYVAAANNNRLRTITVPAPRGVIVDSSGKVVLVDNRPALAVGLRLIDVPRGQLRTELSTLATYLGSSPAAVRENVARHAGSGLKVLATRVPDAAISALRAAALPGVYATNGSAADDGNVDLAPNGTTVVTTVGKQTVTVTVPAVPDHQLDHVIARLSAALESAHVPASSPPELYESFVRQASLAYDVVIAKQDVKQARVLQLREHQQSFPGLEVRTDYLRAYPLGTLAEHVLGSVGPVTVDELKQRQFAGLPSTAVVGQGGVEYTYDQWLRGRDGQYKIEVDSMGRPKANAAIPGGVSAVPGDTLQLSINAKVQKAAENAIVEGVNIAHKNKLWKAAGGAAVVMDVKTGAIIASASNPTYDPTIYQSGTAKQWKKVIADRSLLNNVDQGQYATGSTFKPITAVAALESGVVTKYSTFFCNGSFKKDKQTFKCWSYPVGHGNVNMESAIMESCDVYFYNLGFIFNGRHGTELEDWATRLGFGKKTGVDVPGEYPGLVPTPTWKRAHYSGPTWHEVDRIWNPGDSIQMAIGQGYFLATPLQLATAYAAIANGGNVVTPHVGMTIMDPAGRLVQSVATPAPRHLDISQSTLDTIREGLKLAANATNGTSAPVFAGYPVMVAGKTGTAEKVGEDYTAWYASFAPANDPKYVVVVMIHQGGHGGTSAAPAAKLIYDALFNIKGGVATGTLHSD
jgi:penicillin-binding protein 2